MDDDGGASPSHHGGAGGSIRLQCECGFKDDYSLDDTEDGRFYCGRCYGDLDTQATAVDHADFQTPGNMSFHRVSQPTKTPAPYPAPYPGQPPAAPPFEESHEPRDFVPGAGPEELGARVRRRYVEGLQVILQQQLQVLVERYRVGALVCGVAGTVWLRWVAASKVFDGMWARKVLAGAGAEATQRLMKRSASGGEQKPQGVKCEWADEAAPQKDRRRVEFIYMRSLRTMLPLYSTLSVCFLACHIAREAVLPTDIYRWAMEGKLPYVAAFMEVDKLLGSPLRHCPLNARQLFRPVRVIGAWQLEAAAGFVAQRIGLQLPSVNFYAIAQRYLDELSLPIERILPHACRIYEWAMPPELWLSSNPARVPTRVCVMAILIVALRVQYNINGQGVWEEICEAARNPGGSDHDANLSPSMKPDVDTSEELGTRELLWTLVDAYDKIDVAHDYSKDLHTYLRYCKDVVFPGIACSVEEEHLIEIFQDLYKVREDENSKAHTTNGANKRGRDGTSAGARCVSALSSSGIQSIKSEMEDHGFCYMPPRKWPKSDGYLHYRRKTMTGHLVCAGHADYYLLLRSFAKLAEVDIRVMHASVLKLERRLGWIEERIGRSLDALQNLPS
ncbi:TATA box-binding protein-associated factor RNA polymerase I subunit B-like [Triticum dicoccoides]|uniref:TATA box-binding protein-associated factor RNA polymerase I subunit B-like n=1 Tax=Triticum dicoccoides TaxID=85692 RepID=UPI00188F3E70|nr:TATA box-binding protein-associated factor RNA polymerase I subunit B-like [Triticum dicoccoides]